MPKLTIRGTSHDISWPPENGDWRVLEEYMKAQNQLIHKLTRALVSVEKKAHWGMPTSPVMKRRCPWVCKDAGGHPVDPLSPDDEGDGSGGGSGDQQDDLGWE